MWMNPALSVHDMKCFARSQVWWLTVVPEPVSRQILWQGCSFWHRGIRPHGRLWFWGGRRCKRRPGSFHQPGSVWSNKEWDMKFDKYFISPCILGSKHVSNIYLCFVSRYGLDRRLWGGELKGPCSRRGLLRLGRSRLSTSLHRGWGEGMGQVHRLPAILLVRRIMCEIALKPISLFLH